MAAGNSCRTAYKCTYGPDIESDSSCSLHLGCHRQGLPGIKYTLEGLSGTAN
jgi:hypothetical protein